MRQMKARRWPNLFVIGAAKSGTTSLHYYLAQHPSVFMSVPKEPHFFSRIQPSPELSPFFPHVESEAEYLSLFESATHAPVRGDASTSYLWAPDVPARIRDATTDPRFIAILRDPVDRAFSHYLNNVREGTERRSFGEAIDEELRRTGPSGWGVNSLYVQLGYYARQLARYLEIFGKERVLVLVFEQFIKDTVGTMREVFEFLGVDAEIAQRLSTEKKNPYLRPRGRLASRIMGSGFARRSAHRLLPSRFRGVGRAILLKAAQKPQLEETLETRLRSHFAPEIVALGRVTDRTFPWARFQ